MKHPIAWRSALIGASCLLVVPAGPSSVGVAQTLNQATTAQLAADVNFEPCALLLGTDPVSVLGTGALANICSRSINQAGVPASSSGGGFAGTAPSAPAVVESRLEAEDEESVAAIRGFFVTIGQDSIDRSRTTFEDGYASDVDRFALGYDQGFGQSWLAGIAVDSSKQDGNFLDGGNFEIENLGVTGFGSFLFGETSSVEFYVGLAQLSNKRQRRATFTEVQGTPQFPDIFSVVGAPRSDFDADQTLFGVSYAHDWVSGNLTFGPRLGYDQNKTDYETYREVDASGLALTFHDDAETSTQWWGGFTGSVALGTGFGVVLIEQSLLYRHESDQDQRFVQVSYVEDTRARRFTYQTEVPDRDFLDLAVGATLVLQGGLQVMVDYRSISSHDYLDTDAFAVGFRKEF